MDTVLVYTSGVHYMHESGSIKINLSFTSMWSFQLRRIKKKKKNWRDKVDGGLINSWDIKVSPVIAPSHWDVMRMSLDHPI